LTLRFFYRPSDLSYHKIKDIRFTALKLKYPGLVGKDARLDVHRWESEANIHVLYTDKGASGWGLNRVSQETINSLFSLIRDKNVGELINPLTGILSPLNEVFDFSLYDHAGKILKNQSTVYSEKGNLIFSSATVVCYILMTLNHQIVLPGLKKYSKSAIMIIIMATASSS